MYDSLYPYFVLCNFASPSVPVKITYFLTLQNTNVIILQMVVFVFLEGRELICFEASFLSERSEDSFFFSVITHCVWQLVRSLQIILSLRNKNFSETK
jgi:hypothetical protein